MTVFLGIWPHTVWVRLLLTCLRHQLPNDEKHTFLVAENIRYISCILRQAGGCLYYADQCGCLLRLRCHVGAAFRVNHHECRAEGRRVRLSTVPGSPSAGAIPFCILQVTAS